MAKTEQRELYLHTKNFFMENLERISPDCVCPPMAIKQVVKKAMGKYILDYCSNDTRIEDIFSEEDFQEVSKILEKEIMNNEL